MWVSPAICQNCQAVGGFFIHRLHQTSSACNTRSQITWSTPDTRHRFANNFTVFPCYSRVRSHDVDPETRRLLGVSFFRIYAAPISRCSLVSFLNGHFTRRWHNAAWSRTWAPLPWQSISNTLLRARAHPGSNWTPRCTANATVRPAEEHFSRNWSHCAFWWSTAFGGFLVLAWEMGDLWEFLFEECDASLGDD